MKETAEAVDKLISHVSTILRYFAPGFVILLVLAAVLPCTRGFLCSVSPTTTILAMLSGPVIYGIHTGVIVRWFWYPVVALRLRKLGKAVSAEMTRLDSQRWLRRASEDAEVTRIQAEVDRWASLLNFLYCVGEIMVLVPLAAKLYGKYELSPDWKLVLLGGLLVLTASVISENRMTETEMRLSSVYPDGKKA